MVKKGVFYLFAVPLMLFYVPVMKSGICRVQTEKNAFATTQTQPNLMQQRSVRENPAPAASLPVPCCAPSYDPATQKLLCQIKQELGTPCDEGTIFSLLCIIRNALGQNDRELWSIESKSEVVSSKIDSLSSEVITDFRGTWTVLQEIKQENWSIESKAEVISSKIDKLSHTATPELWSIESKAEVISSKIDTITPALAPELWSIESKAEVISSKIDSIHVNVNFSPIISKLDTIDNETWSIESKAEVISSKIDKLISSDGFSCGCCPTVINTPGTIGGKDPIPGSVTINAPGTFCLAQNLAGNLTISEDNVTLDLNGYTVGGSLTINNNNITIKNGFVAGGAISFAPLGVGNIVIENVTAIGGISGIVDTLTIRQCLIGQVTLTAAHTRITQSGCLSITLQNISHEVEINDCQITSNIKLQNNPNNIQLSNCQINNGSVSITNGVNIVIENCTCNGAGPATSFDLNNCQQSSLIGCKANMGNGGFSITNNCINISLENCTAKATSYGFKVNTAQRVTMTRCIAEGNMPTGFFLEAAVTEIVLEQCIAESGQGFSSTDENNSGVVRECIVTQESGFGFIEALPSGSSIRYVSNSARNGTTGVPYFPSSLAPFYPVDLTAAPPSPDTGYWRNVYL